MNIPALEINSPFRSYGQVRADLQQQGISQTTWLTARRMQFLPDESYQSLLSMSASFEVERIKLPPARFLEVDLKSVSEKTFSECVTGRTADLKEFMGVGPLLRAGAILFKPLSGLFSRIEGLENFPKDQTFLLAMNHPSYFEHMFLLPELFLYLNKGVHFIAHYKLYNKNLWFIKPFLGMASTIPLNPKAKDSCDEVKEKVVRYLREDRIIGINPEGGVSPKLKKAKTGAVQMALEAGVPIVPVGIQDSFREWHSPWDGVTELWRLLFKKALIRVGKPISFKEEAKQFFQASGNTPEDELKRNNILREATRRLMLQIATLSGQEYPY